MSHADSTTKALEDHLAQEKLRVALLEDVYYSLSSVMDDVMEIISDETPEPSDCKFALADIPIGKCCHCGVAQEAPGVGGFWIHGFNNRWACANCKYGVPIRSRPMACEWCTYDQVKFHQGGVYSCPRCVALGIRK